MKYEKLGTEVGQLVDRKQTEYGDSAGKSDRILAVLYPEGIKPHQYQDAMLVTRILDKLSRIAQRGTDGLDKGGESPYRDIAGYGLLGLAKDSEPVAGRVSFTKPERIPVVVGQRRKWRNGRPNASAFEIVSIGDNADSTVNYRYVESGFTNAAWLDDVELNSEPIDEKPAIYVGQRRRFTHEPSAKFTVALVSDERITVDLDEGHSFNYTPSELLRFSYAI